MEDLIQLDSYPVQTALRLLLQDKTTKKNIIWATDSYASFGETYTDRSQITENQLKKDELWNDSTANIERYGAANTADKKECRSIYSSLDMQ